MTAPLQSCRACRRALIDSFVSFAGLSLAHSRTQANVLSRRTQPFATIRTRSAPITRTFKTSAIRSQEQQRSEEPSLGISENDTQSPSTEPQSTAATTLPDTDSAIPWYLRVSTPTPLSPQNVPNPALQEIPPLPSDPPGILEPILIHLSITTGLDALTILDLRNLNPPSALGSNLIMILGTARSEKHLNTSADRFCRWLRNTYKLRPYADGLLGRNELKLKIRRRNKKLKLAQSVGNTMYDADKGYDDGITTGWICCNLGSVDSAQMPLDEDASLGTSESTSAEAHTQEPTVDETSNNTTIHTPSELFQVFSQKDQERPLDDEAEYSNPSDEEFTYRGFGNASMAPKIVVQMFTEEKRAEMDLEGLWEARIRRRDEKEERQDRLFETSVIEQEIETPGVTRVDGEVDEDDQYRPMHGR